MQANKELIPLQIKVFVRWLNNELNKKTNIKINDLTKDLKDGVALVELAQILTAKETPRLWKKKPIRSIEMVQNCDLAIEMFKNDGVHIIGISGKDINDNNEKLILGLIWSLIFHYSIKKSISDIKNKDDKSENDKDDQSDINTDELILSWAIDRVADYPNIHNFTPYALSMCALLDSYVPNKINFYSLDPENFKYNSEIATKVMNELNIPIYIDLNDCNNLNQVDEKSIIIQLSYAKVVLDKLSQNENRLKIDENNVSKELSLSSFEFGSTEDRIDSEVDKIIEETNVKAALILLKFESKANKSLEYEKNSNERQYEKSLSNEANLGKLNEFKKQEHIKESEKIYPNDSKKIIF